MTEPDFKILSPRDHVRIRTGMYLGSSALEEFDRNILGKIKTVKIVPAILKAIDEIIDNSVDEAIRTKFTHANRISVTLSDDSVTVKDNGRGIPLDIIEDSNGEKIVRPVAAWTRTNAGTSFTEDRVTIGANGLGSAAVNFVSSRFVGKTSNGKKGLVVECSDGAAVCNSHSDDKLDKGTEVSFTPDFTLFGVNSLTEMNVFEIIQDRLMSLSVCFPKIKFFLNGNDVSQTLKSYSYLYLENDNLDSVVHQSANLDFFFVGSTDLHRQNSYVNGVNTRQGGSYVDFVLNGVIDKLLELIKKKHKVEVSKTVIKSGLTFVMFARNFAGPKFDSQTKERLTNSVKEITSHFETSGISFEDIAKQLLKSNEIIDPIIAAQIAKKLAADAKAAADAQKKLKKVKIAKHVAANKPGGKLFLVEGDSAIGFAIAVRNPDVHGFYPLKGVSLNTWDVVPKKVLENKEMADVVAILGLDITKPDSYKDMFYDSIGIMSDADADGRHIAILLLGFFYRFWPELLLEGKVHVVQTPIQISTKGKDVKWFYDLESAGEFKSKTSGYVHRYMKGLASLRKQEYSQIINSPVLLKIEPDIPDVFELVLGSDTDRRKTWIVEGTV